MGLALVEPYNIDAPTLLPIGSNVVEAKYLGYGRNAWNSTWVNKYFPSCISFDVDELKRTAETKRKQGSVFKIESVPLLKVHYLGGTLGIIPINDRGKYEYDKLFETIIRNDLKKFWNYMPNSEHNWLLIFAIRAKQENKIFTPYSIRSFSAGSGYFLGWSNHNRPPVYPEFMSFAGRFQELIDRTWKEELARELEARRAAKLDYLRAI